MSAMSNLDVELREQAIREEVEELEARDDHAATFHHVDGSATVIVYDEDKEHANPRDNDGNVVRFIQLNRDFRDLDEPDAGIDEARDRFFDYGARRGPRPGWRRAGYGRDDMVRRYLAMFRPDIVFYDEWSAQGTSQGDHIDGYAYVRREDIADLPAIVYNTDADLFLGNQARYHFDAELKVFRQYWRGEVYGAIHLEIDDDHPLIDYGPHGAYVAGYRVTEESVWGFLGYDQLSDIAGEMTASPVIERV